jgi:hypothetical protein
MIILKLISMTGLCIIFSISALSQSTSQKNIAFQPADDSNVSVFIVLKDLPKQYFLFTVPEIFMAENFEQGMFNGDLVPWTIKGNQAYRKVEKFDLSYWVNLSLHHENNISWMDWTIHFQNGSKDTVRNLSAFNCLTMDRAPLFKDTAMNRTWVKDADGKTTILSKITKTTGNGRRTMQFYHSVKGIEDLSTIPWLRDWGVISPQKLSGNKMWVNSIDGKWQIETLTEGDRQPAFFFNNWEPDHGCIHASPLISEELLPGETTSVRGKFRFIKLRKGDSNND